MKRSRWRYGAVALVALAACTLTTSFDGLTGGGSSGADAGPDGASGADAAVGGSDGAGLGDAQDLTRPCSAPPTTAFCEDFEGAASRLTFGTVDGGAAEIVTDRVHAGHAAMHAKGSGWFLRDAPAPSLFYLRMFVYLASLPAPSPSIDAYFALFFTASLDGVSLGVKSGVAEAVTHFSLGRAQATSTFPVDRWACLEWRVSTAPPGDVTASIDGAPVDLHLADFVPDGSSFDLTATRFGVMTFPSSDGTPEAWIDDLRIDTQPIGCR